MLDLERLERIQEALRNCCAQEAHYYTDGGIHFYGNPSNRKANKLTYVGLFRNAKEAREFYYSPLGTYLRRNPRKPRAEA